MKNCKKYLLIFLLPFLLSLFFIFFDQDARDIKSDARIYFTIANNLVNGHGFSDETDYPYLPTMEREPIYPLFLSLIFYLFKNNIFIAQIIQALIYALTCVIVFIIISHICTDKRISFISAMAVSIFPVLANYTAYLITETLFTFLLSLLILSLMKSFEYNRLKWYFCSGIILGIATLCRATLMFLGIFLIFLLSLHFYREYRKLFTYKLIRASTVLLLGFFMVITPWIMRNYIHFRKIGITLRGNGSLYIRASKVNLNKRELAMYTVYSFSEYIAGKLYPHYNLTSTGDGYFYKIVLEKKGEFGKQYLSEEEIDTAFGREAVSLIKTHPLKFIALGIFEIIKFNSFAQIFLLNETFIKEIVKNQSYLSFLRGLFKLSGFFIVFFAIRGMVSAYKDWHRSIILSFIIIYFNIIYFFFDSVGRYAVPILPYYMFFCIVSIREMIIKRKLGILV